MGLPIFLDWTYVSRRAVFTAGAGLLAIAALAYAKWGPGPSAARRARTAIAAADRALTAAQSHPESVRRRSRLADGMRELTSAQTALQMEHPEEAINHAIAARSIAQKILEGTTGWDATLVDGDGRVEIQRSGKTSWESISAGTKLFEGDFVKTGSSGSAEVMAADGTLYGIRSGTLFEVRRTRLTGELRPGSEVKVVTGTITTATGVERSTIVTDGGTTKVSSKSRGEVEVDTARETRVSLFDGTAHVDAKGGGAGVELAAREGVRLGADGDLRPERLKLPSPPRPLRPDEDAVFDSRSAARIGLAWEKVPGAAAYRVQIAKSRLFVPDSILADVPDRVKTEATVSVNDEGSFFWRVASVATGGQVSEWSGYRRFRVSSPEELGASGKEPPALDVQPPRVIGENLVAVVGRTEPGARVMVNGERADPEGDGSFRKIIALSRSGYSNITVKSTNGAGLVSTRNVRVLIRVD